MKKKNTFVKKAAPWTIPLLIIFSWQGLSSLDLISERFLSSPAAILSAAYELTADGSVKDVAVVCAGFFGDFFQRQHRVFFRTVQRNFQIVGGLVRFDHSNGAQYPPFGINSACDFVVWD